MKVAGWRSSSIVKVACLAGRLVFFKFQIRLSLNPLKEGPALLSGKKLPLKTVITFFELDKVVCAGQT